MIVLFLFHDALYAWRKDREQALTRHDRAFAGGGDALSSLIAQVLAESGARKKSPVCILSDEVIAQRLQFPAAQLTGLSEHELKSAVAYELSAFSGLGESDSFLACRKGRTQGGTVELEALQIAKDGFRSLQNGVEAAGCRLLGVGAIPQSAESHEDASLERVATAAEKGLLICDETERTASTRSLVGLGVAALLTVFVAGSVAVGMLEKPVSEAEQQLLELHERLEQERQLKRELKNRMRRPISEVEGDVASGEQQRRAWSTLFSALGKAFHERAVLKSWEECAPWDVRLTALATNAAAQEKAFEVLSEAAAEAGWFVTLESLSALRPGVQNSIWEFTMRISRADASYTGNAATMYPPREEKARYSPEAYE